MKERDCENCKHHTEDGCSSWDCEFEKKDLISRADAIEAVCRTRCGDKAKGCPAHSCLVIEEFDALPSAETHEIRTETHGVCLISKDDAMGAVQDHFNANGFKEYDDGQKMMDRIKALPSADAVPQLRQTDTLIIADALRYLAKDTERHLVDRTRADALRQQFLKYGASMCKGGDDE